mmetsp:Transcript_122884/g.393668  ORF Transcript_122884/g.393668 Transcript_122884/m.393668 type:complete len:299 (+) Transcript_122884:182-1078(+)
MLQRLDHLPSRHDVTRLAFHVGGAPVGCPVLRIATEHQARALLPALASVRGSRGWALLARPSSPARGLALRAIGGGAGPILATAAGVRPGLRVLPSPRGRFRLLGRPLELLLGLGHHVEEGVAEETLEKVLELPLREHAVTVGVRGLEEGLQPTLPGRREAKVVVERVDQLDDLRPLQGAVSVDVELAEVLLACVLEHRGAAEERSNVLGVVGVDGPHLRAAEVPQHRGGLARVAVVFAKHLRDAVRPEVGEALAQPREHLAPILLPEPQVLSPRAHHGCSWPAARQRSNERWGPPNG